MEIHLSAIAAQNNRTGGLSQATRQVLPNGLVVLAHYNPSSPTVSIRGDVGVGAVHETSDQAGLATFTASSLIRGTQSRTFQQIVSETEERGCNVGAGGGMHHSSFSGKALKEDVPLVLEILAEMLIYPTFPIQELEKLRAQFLMYLQESAMDTQYQASRALRTLLYPPEHPYSRLTSGTPETIGAIARDDLLAFHQWYRPAEMVIAVVGDILPDEAVAQIEAVFGSWETTAAPRIATLPEVAPLQGVQREDVAIDGKVQTDIIWAVHGLKRSDPDYYPAMLANMILGQFGMGGRLGNHIREEEGLAYYVNSGLNADIGAGPWAAIAGVNPSATNQALDGMLTEIERFKQEGPTEQELADVRAYLTGSLVLGLETNAGIAGALLSIERHQLGLDFIDRYPAMINAIPHDEIVRVARAYLSTENYVVAVAGPPMEHPDPSVADATTKGEEGEAL